MSLNLPDIFNLFMFVLVSADEFYYTSHGEDPIINGVDDAEVLCDTREALNMLGRH